jgi:RNase P protein component
VREIFRRHKSALGAVDIVVNGRAPLPAAELRSLESEMLSCLRPFLKTA